MPYPLNMFSVLSRSLVWGARKHTASPVSFGALPLICHLFSLEVSAAEHY